MVFLREFHEEFALIFRRDRAKYYLGFIQLGGRWDVFDKRAGVFPYPFLLNLDVIPEASSPRF